MNLRATLPETISDEQVGELENQIKNEFGMNDAPFEKNKTYLVRTVTMINVGKVKNITRHFVTLTNAIWVADTGKFGDCLKAPDKFNEVETFHKDVHINLQSIVDFTEWPFTYKVK